jgi:hypothetical protein
MGAESQPITGVCRPASRLGARRPKERAWRADCVPEGRAMTRPSICAVMPVVGCTRTLSDTLLVGTQLPVVLPVTLANSGDAARSVMATPRARLTRQAGIRVPPLCSGGSRRVSGSAERRRSTHDGHTERNRLCPCSGCKDELRVGSQDAAMRDFNHNAWRRVVRIRRCGWRHKTVRVWDLRSSAKMLSIYYRWIV